MSALSEREVLLTVLRLAAVVLVVINCLWAIRTRLANGQKRRAILIPLEIIIIIVAIWAD